MQTRCERCWSEVDVRGKEGRVDLCRACRAVEPKDPLVRETLFLRFASRKELLNHYGTAENSIALKRWATQNKLSSADAIPRLLADEGALALFGEESILRIGPRRRGTPYGYRGGDEGLVQVSEEAGAICEFFRMYAKGRSLRQIAEVADRQQIPTSRGGQWQASTIRHILRNPIYVGRMRRNHMVREGGPPAIVDRELFESVQRGLTRRAKRASETNGGGPSSPPV